MTGFILFLLRFLLLCPGSLASAVGSTGLFDLIVLGEYCWQFIDCALPYECRPASFQVLLLAVGAC